MVQLAIGFPSLRISEPVLHEERGAHSLRLLYVGRLLEWKGCRRALRGQSAPAISGTFASPIAATGRRDRGLSELQRNLGFVGCGHWAGQRTELEEHYLTADVLLFPSLRDSGGMVVLEALAHGLPVLCTDLGRAWTRS